MAKKFTSTRKCVQYGPSTYVCIDKSWGINPGDVVKVTIELVERAGIKPEE